MELSSSKNYFFLKDIYESIYLMTWKTVTHEEKYYPTVGKLIDKMVGEEPLLTPWYPVLLWSSSVINCKSSLKYYFYSAEKCLFNAMCYFSLPTEKISDLNEDIFLKSAALQ